MPTLSGTWQFIAEPQVSGLFSVEITFHSNRLLFSKMFVQHECLWFKYLKTDSPCVAYSAYNNEVVNAEQGWNIEAYQIISFPSTQTVTDEFYEWFTANARKVPAGKISGKWKFNEVLTPIGETSIGASVLDIRQNVNFTWVRSGTVKTATGITQYDFHDSSSGSDVVTISCLCFTLGFGVHPYEFTANKWTIGEDQYDRTVDFGETEQTVSYDFYTWLLENATPVGAYVPTEIAYNGVSSSVEAGQTATLTCNGKRMKTDIVFVFGSAGTITYNSTETAVEAGETATLACAGKRMKTDVVVSL